MRIVRTLVLVLAGALLAGGCVISRAPLLGSANRVVPFESGTRFRIYERDSATAPWKRDEKDVVLVADTNKVVRESDDSRKEDADEYTFHPLGPNRYLVQARFGAARYAYGALEIRGGEGYVVAFQCKKIDAATLRGAGVVVSTEDCLLEGAPDAVGFLKQLAVRPGEALIKYVPVKKK
jgi:hypothetical protein